MRFKYQLLLFISILIILFGMNFVSAMNTDLNHTLNSIDVDDSIDEYSICSIDN